MPAPESDYYALLEIHPSAGTEQIRAAYLRQVFQWHPDRNPSEEATRRTAQINAAWEVLQDQERRRIYDRRLSRSRAASSRPGPAERPARRSPTKRGASAPDPAAAERMRRAQAASARAAAERQRRDAEYERRRQASESLWKPPPEAGLGWADRNFVVGHWYRNNRGPYKVIDVRASLVDVFYPDGDITTLRRDELWRHWEQQAAKRSRPGRAGGPSPRRI